MYLTRRIALILIAFLFSAVAAFAECATGTQLRGGKCVKPAPVKIICDGGRVRNGKCACPEGTDLKQTGDNASACIKPSLKPDPALTPVRAPEE
jgi:hypothetical protein